MSKLLMVFFVFVLMSGFVVAVSSEVTTNFVVNKSLAVANDASDFVPPVPSFWDDYGSQLVAVVALVIIYVLFKMSVKKAKVSRRKKK